jgi:hypothetical protein
MASGVFVSCRAPEDVADGAHVQAALQTFLDNAEDVANVDAVNQLEAFFRDQLGIARNRTVRARVLRVEKDRFKVRVCLLPSVLNALPALPACIDERFVLGAHAARAAHDLVQVLCCPRPAGEAGQARQPRGLPFEADCGFFPAAVSSGHSPCHTGPPLVQEHVARGRGEVRRAPGARQQFQPTDCPVPCRFLEEQVLGTVVIRPHQHALDQLTMSWRCSKDPFLVKHEVLEELAGTGGEKKAPQDASLGRTLKLGMDLFDDLDEIVARYVEPQVGLIRELQRHKYYRAISPEQVEGLLLDERARDPQATKYFFIPNPRAAGHFHLWYQTSRRAKKLYVTISRRGFFMADVRREVVCAGLTCDGVGGGAANVCQHGPAHDVLQDALAGD